MPIPLSQKRRRNLPVVADMTRGNMAGSVCSPEQRGACMTNYRATAASKLTHKSVTVKEFANPGGRVNLSHCRCGAIVLILVAFGARADTDGWSQYDSHHGPCPECRLRSGERDHLALSARPRLSRTGARCIDR